MESFELSLRTAAVLQLLLLAALLLRGSAQRRRADPTPIMGALFCAGAAAFVATSAAGAEPRLGVWIYPLTALCVTKAAFFWLFAKGLFADSLRLHGRHLALCAATATYGLWQQLVFTRRDREALAAGWETVASFGFELLILAFVLAALGEAYRGLAGELVERRRRLRILFVAGAGSYLAAAALVQGYNLLLDASTPRPLVLGNLALVWAAALWACWTLAQVRPGSWLEVSPRTAPAALLPAAEARLLAALQDALERDRIYRDEELTIGALARRLGTREQVLRRVINQGLGYRNFNDFLHHYRIREACARLQRSEDAHLPVLSIALAVGYGSIGPFNRAFKARVGMTPTAFRRSSPAAVPRSA